VAPVQQTPKSLSIPASITQLIADHSIDPVIACAEASKLDLLASRNLLPIAIAPFNRHIRVSVCINEHVESAWLGEFWQKGDRRGDLSEQCSDRALNLFFRQRLVCCRWCCGSAGYQVWDQYLFRISLTLVPRSPCQCPSSRIWMRMFCLAVHRIAISRCGPRSPCS
jgi:hypothetical protein